MGRRQPTAWSGLIIFAAVLLMITGAFNVLYGFVALFKDEFLVPTTQGILVFDVTAWGWIILLLGAFQVLVALSVMSGQTWARAVGVVIAGVNALGQMAFLSAQPIWSVIIIALDVLVIYALIAHGREVKY